MQIQNMLYPVIAQAGKQLIESLKLCLRNLYKLVLVLLLNLVVKNAIKFGTWMIVEPFANDKLEDNLNPVGRDAASSLVQCI
jgi:hypothetical protein